MFSPVCINDDIFVFHAKFFVLQLRYNSHLLSEQQQAIEVSKHVPGFALLIIVNVTSFTANKFSQTVAHSTRTIRAIDRR